MCSTKNPICFHYFRVIVAYDYNNNNVSLIPYTVKPWYFSRLLSYRENLIPLQPLTTLLNLRVKSETEIEQKSEKWFNYINATNKNKNNWT